MTDSSHEIVLSEKQELLLAAMGALRIAEAVDLKALEDDLRNARKELVEAHDALAKLKELLEAEKQK